jgi:hypothetical protein
VLPPLITTAVTLGNVVILATEPLSVQSRAWCQRRSSARSRGVVDDGRASYGKFRRKADRILIYNTGSGYKYLEAWQRVSEQA